MNLIEQAITDYWGQQCHEYRQGCSVCEAWEQYHTLRDRADEAEVQLKNLTFVRDWELSNTQESREG